MRLVFAIVCALFSISVLASSKTLRLDINKSDVIQQIDAIALAVKDSKEFYEISENDKTTVLQTLQFVKSEMSSGNASGKSNLMPEQEKVNAILDRAEADSRLHCVREKALGSHMPTKICMTVAARRRSSEKAANSLRAQENKLDSGRSAGNQ